MIELFGPLSAIFPVLITTALAGVLIVSNWRNGIVLQVFPSSAWLVFMAVPFLMNSGGIKPVVAFEQAVGISMITAALLIGDYFGAQRFKNTVQSPVEGGLNDKIWAGAALLALLAVIYFPIYHLAHVGSIPFLAQFWDRSGLEAANSREEFNKLLQVPLIYKFVFNWVTMIFGPIIAIYVFPKAKQSWAWRICLGLVVCWIAGYAVLSTARAPFVMFLVFSATASVIYWSSIWKKMARLAVMAFLLVTLSAGIIRSVELVRYQNSEGIKDYYYSILMKRIPSQHPLMGLTLGDVARLMGDSRILNLPFLNTITYRAFLVPSEVSSHWYAFYPDLSNGWRTSSEVVGIRDEKIPHAANRVGRWSYYERFPKFYLDSVSAYASIDADAYSFGGLWVTFIAAVSLLMIRIIAGIYALPSRISAVSALVIVQIGLLVMSASLQAILIAQGMFILLATLLFALSAEILMAARPKII